MAEDKPFDATPARLARARRSGDVPRSRDLSAVAAFAAAALALVGVTNAIGGAARRALAGAVGGVTEPGPYVVIALAACAVFASAAAAGASAAALQGGVALRFPAPDLRRLAPAAGLRRTFGRAAAAGALKASVAAVGIGAAVAAGAAGAGAAAGAGSAAGLAAVAVHAVAVAAAGGVVLAAGFAAADVVLERAAWRRRLRMSFDEVKRDHKQSEGDPQLRGRRRQAHRALVRGSIGRVADAAFVVANPTHVAVALEYRPPAVAVPRVLVRAVDAGARAVKERARALGVPVVENAPLARALLAGAGVGDPIPRDTYAAVATIVALLARGRTAAP